MHAAVNVDARLALLLLLHGADARRRSRFGWSALDVLLGTDVPAAAVDPVTCDAAPLARLLLWAGAPPAPQSEGRLRALVPDWAAAAGRGVARPRPAAADLPAVLPLALAPPAFKTRARALLLSLLRCGVTRGAARHVLLQMVLDNLRPPPVA
jgi:hypothetical protein